MTRFQKMPEMLDIVDENGVPTGQSVPRTTAHAEGLRHRTRDVYTRQGRGPGSLAAGGGRGAGRGLPPPQGGCTVNETQRRRALADVKEFFLRAGALAALLLVLFGVVFL